MAEIKQNISPEEALRLAQVAFDAEKLSGFRSTDQKVKPSNNLDAAKQKIYDQENLAGFTKKPRVYNFDTEPEKSDTKKAA